MAFRRDEGRSLDDVRAALEGSHQKLSDEDVSFLVEQVERHSSSREGIDASKLLREAATQRPDLVAEQADELVAFVAEHKERRLSGLLWNSFLEALERAVEDAEVEPAVDPATLVSELAAFVGGPSQHEQRAAASIAAAFDLAEPGTDAYRRLDDAVFGDTADVSLEDLTPTAVDRVESLLASEGWRDASDLSTEPREKALALAVVYAIDPDHALQNVADGGDAAATVEALEPGVLTDDPVVSGVARWLLTGLAERTDPTAPVVAAVRSLAETASDPTAARTASDLLDRLAEGARDVPLTEALLSVLVEAVDADDPDVVESATTLLSRLADGSLPDIDTVAEVAAASTHDDAQVRALMADLLGRFAERATDVSLSVDLLAGLEPALASDDHEIRGAASTLLSNAVEGTEPNPDLLAGVVRHATHDNREVRDVAVALADRLTDGAETVPLTAPLLAALVPAMEHADDEVRGMAGTVVKNHVELDAVPERLDDESVALLCDLLGSTDPGVSDTAKEALDALLVDDVDRFLRCLPASSMGARHVAAYLVDRLGDGRTRPRAVHVLAEQADDWSEELADDVPAIGAAISADDEAVQRDACRTLASIGTETAIQRLQDGLREIDDYELRSDAESMVQEARERRREQTVDADQLQSGIPQPEAATTPDRGDDGGDLPAHDVLEPIGSGGNADVKKVRLNDSGTVAALKIPRWQGTISQSVVEEFTSEASTWSRIDDHENIVDVLGSGTTPYPWILLDYAPDGSLRERLDRGGLSPTEAGDFLLGVCQAIRHAHRHGIVHADLKPENVLFDGDTPKVGDWGLAQVLLEHSKSIEGMTPSYAAPEQLDPDSYGSVDDYTDVYQLGIMAYEAFTGRLPYESDNPAGTITSILSEEPTPPTAVEPSLPPAVDDVVLTAMAKDKADRYESVLYLRDELRDLF